MAFVFLYPKPTVPQLPLHRTVVLGTLCIYIQDLTIVANEALRSELMNHILAVPFLFIYLIYRKRKMLRTTIPFEPPETKRKTIQTHEMIGALLCLLAFLLYWHGSYTFYPLEYHIVFLLIFTAGLLLAIRDGWRMSMSNNRGRPSLQIDSKYRLN